MSSATSLMCIPESYSTRSASRSCKNRLKRRGLRLHIAFAAGAWLSWFAKVRTHYWRRQSGSTGLDGPSGTTVIGFSIVELFPSLPLAFAL